MNILGIDTSCDDTSAAIVADGMRVLANVINSQVKLHYPYGVVVPELASREHVRNIVPVVDAALSQASIEMKDIDAIAVTVGPGLAGALLVGLYYAKALSAANGIPLIYFRSCSKMTILSFPLSHLPYQEVILASTM